MPIILTPVTFNVILKRGIGVIHITKAFVHPISWIDTLSPSALVPLKMFPLRGKISLCMVVRISPSNSWLLLKLCIPPLFLHLLFLLWTLGGKVPCVTTVKTYEGLSFLLYFEFFLSFCFCARLSKTGVLSNLSLTKLMDPFNVATELLSPSNIVST